MKINEKGLQLLKQFEGCRLIAYRDVVGIWTIGYGHTGSGVRSGFCIDQARADSLLEEDLQRFESQIESSVEVDLNSNQFSALVCFTYNVGYGLFLKSTLLRLLNSGDYAGAAKQLLRFNRAGGIVRSDLVRRRQAEMELFNSSL